MKQPEKLAVHLLVLTWLFVLLAASTAVIVWAWGRQLADQDSLVDRVNAIQAKLEQASKQK